MRYSMYSTGRRTDLRVGSWRENEIARDLLIFFIKPHRVGSQIPTTSFARQTSITEAEASIITSTGIRSNSVPSYCISYSTNTAVQYDVSPYAKITLEQQRFESCSLPQQTATRPSLDRFPEATPDLCRSYQTTRRENVNMPCTTFRPSKAL